MNRTTHNSNSNNSNSNSENSNKNSSSSSKSSSSKSISNNNSKSITERSISNDKSISNDSSISNDNNSSISKSKRLSNDSNYNADNENENVRKDEYSPISRYIKSFDFDNNSLSNPIVLEQKAKEDLKSKDIDTKKQVSKKGVINDSRNDSKSASKKEKDNVYLPPYDTEWFETEKGLSLEMYLKHLFQIARDNLQCNLNKDTTKAILVPHAGIKYSGICSASAYYELHNRTKRINRIILLCTNHPSEADKDIFSYKLNIIGTNYSKIASYRAGIGKSKLSIDTKTMEKLKPYIEINDELFDNENGFFTQLPFIETIAADALICPLLIGQMKITPENNNKIREVLNILKKLLEKEGTVLVCTSDLAHINGHFEHKFTNYINQHIRKSDSETLQFLYNIIDGVKTRMNKIDEMLFLQNSPSCGIFAMYIFGKLLNLFTKAQSGIHSDSSGSNDSSSSLNNNLEYKKYFHSRVSCYYTSLIRDYIDVFNFNKNQLIHLLDITDMKTSSVSYAGVVFTTQGNIQTRRVRKIELICSEYEKIALLGIAKEQLFYKLSSKHGLLINSGLNNTTSKIPDSLIRPIASPIFKLNLGVFVTLYKNDELRGCIGTLETDNDEATIENNVKKYVLEAAIKDTRFKPVEISEFNKLEFSITILYTMKPITINEYFGSKFVLGRDGILLSQGTGNRQGYFLPSVATEFKYDKQKLLEELCVNKIGLNTKECFRSSNTTLFYNEGLEFTTK